MLSWVTGSSGIAASQAEATMQKLDRRSLALLVLVGLASPLSAAADNAVNVITGGSNVMIFGADPAMVAGNGKIVRSERAVGAATELDLDGAFLATVTLGAGPSLVIQGDENVLPLIRSEGTGGKLHIFAEGSYRTEKPISVILSLPALAQLSAGGSNSVALTGVAGPALALSMSGSNSISVAGRVGALSATLSGADRLAADTLEADEASVRIEGSGSAALRVIATLKAEIDGSGSIDVHGHPAQRRVQVNGSGSINYVD
jgi:Putative auto-transporter adhesin, head GIN domain